MTNKVELTIRKSKTVKEALNKYFINNTIGDFDKIPTAKKLAYLQKTPDSFKRTRVINNMQINYVDNVYAKKCLNFAFNFDWGYTKTGESIREYKNAKNNTVFEVIVFLDFYANFDGKTIRRSVTSGHTYYENPATNRGDAYKAAISKGITNFAEQFGIGQDVKTGSKYHPIDDENMIEVDPSK